MEIKTAAEMLKEARKNCFAFEHTPEAIILEFAKSYASQAVRLALEEAAEELRDKRGISFYSQQVIGDSILSLADGIICKLK